MKNINITYYSRFIAKDWEKEANVATRRPRRGGFTLLEMLVVVLIIGVLASIALPEYQRAVEKSRASQALILLKAIGQAAEKRFFTTGTESFPSFDVLSVNIPWKKSSRVIGGSHDSRSNGEWTLEIEASPASGATVIFMTRMKGKYQGAGFYMVLGSTAGHNGQVRPYCMERISSSTKIFDSALAPGAYCVDIMEGTLSSESEWQRGYNL